MILGDSANEETNRILFYHLKCYDMTIRFRL